MVAAMTENYQKMKFKELRHRCRNNDRAAEEELARRLLAVRIYGSRISDAGLVINKLIDDVRNGLTDVNLERVYLHRLKLKRIDKLRYLNTLKARMLRGKPASDETSSPEYLPDARVEQSPASKMADDEIIDLIGQYVAQEMDAKLIEVYHRRIGGEKFEEIAGALGIPASTVKSQFRSALSQILEKLRELQDSTETDVSA